MGRTKKVVSFYLDDRTIALVAEHRGDGKSLGSVVERAIDRYDAICRRCLPSLSVDDLRAVREAFEREHGALSPQMLCAGLRDGGDPASEALADRLEPLGYASWVAVLSAVERNIDGQSGELDVTPAGGSSGSVDVRGWPAVGGGGAVETSA